MPTKKKDTKKKEAPKRKTTAKDLPGNGLARKAGNAIEQRRRKMKEMLDNI